MKLYNGEHNITDASNIFPGVGVDTSENWEMEKCVLHCLKGMG